MRSNLNYGINLLRVFHCGPPLSCFFIPPWVCIGVTLMSATRGSLLTRSLADIVKKEDFVLDSEYLITMLVVVPK